MDNKSEEVKTLIEKAAAATDSAEAMRFSKAACNAANAMLAVLAYEKEGARK